MSACVASTVMLAKQRHVPGYTCMPSVHRARLSLSHVCLHTRLACTHGHKKQMRAAVQIIHGQAKKSLQRSWNVECLHMHNERNIHTSSTDRLLGCFCLAAAAARTAASGSVRSRAFTWATSSGGKITREPMFWVCEEQRRHLCLKHVILLATMVSMC